MVDGREPLKLTIPFEVSLKESAHEALILGAYVEDPVARAYGELQQGKEAAVSLPAGKPTAVVVDWSNGRGSWDGIFSFKSVSWFFGMGLLRTRSGAGPGVLCSLRGPYGRGSL